MEGYLFDTMLIRETLESSLKKGGYMSLYRQEREGGGGRERARGIMGPSDKRA